MNGFFESIFDRLLKGINYSPMQKDMAKKRPSVMCLSDTWISKVIEDQILHLNKNDGLVVYVHESVENEMVCTKAILCHKIIEATNWNDQSFVVVCIYVSP